MKKLIIATLVLFGMSGAIMAQTTPAKTKTAAKPKTEVAAKKVKPETSVSSVTPAKPAEKKPANAKTAATPKKEVAAKPSASTAKAPVKKDGTPDKRYSAN